MTEVYSYRAEINSNWKLFIDAFAEFYHAPVLHMKQATKEEAEKLARVRVRGAALRHQGRPLDGVVLGRHGSAEGPQHGQAHRANPAQRPVRPVGPPRHQGHPARRAAAGHQPRRASKPWGSDSFEFFPNFTLLFWAPGWYLTYHYWPTAVDSHIFEANLYFVPPKTARERLSQELAAVTFKEYAFQDANTLEATQTQIGTRVVTDFPLCDQEILLRHLHKTARDNDQGVRECLDTDRTKTGSRARANSPTWSGSPTGACPPSKSATASG